MEEIQLTEYSNVRRLVSNLPVPDPLSQPTPSTHDSSATLPVKNEKVNAGSSAVKQILGSVGSSGNTN
jgi:hypothetical protein